MNKKIDAKDQKKALSCNLNVRHIMKLLQLLSKIILILMIVVFCYGTYKFPDAPIHPCGENKYCGKGGQFHSQQDYEIFKIWENTLMITWSIGIIILFIADRK